MSITKKILKGGIVLSLGEGLGYGASFIRNVLLARILTRQDFGIASTFALVVSLLEITGRLAIAQVLVQSKHGDSDEFLGTAHTIQLASSLLSACLIFANASVLAAAFGVSSAKGAMAGLAMLPLFKGFEHLGARQMGRNMIFAPGVIIEVAPQFVVTMLAWPLACWFCNFRVVLYLLIIKAFLSLAVSHLVATNRYKLQFSREHARTILAFGWPLLVSGTLMFGVYQGDRWLVGSFYSMEVLGAYSVAALLTLVPGYMFTQVLTSVMLPLLSRTQETPESFTTRYKLCMQAICVCASMYAILLILGGDSIVVACFSKKYAGTAAVLSWLAVGNAFRMLRLGPVLITLARGDSRTSMIASCLRAVGLIPAFYAASYKMELWVVAACCVAGEVLAFCYVFYAGAKHHKIAPSLSAKPVGLGCVAILLSASFVLMFRQNSLLVTILVIVVGAGISLATMLFAFDELRNKLLVLVRGVAARLTSMLASDAV